ncbi:uncharacterized protein DUF2264 [Breznakibacter xylanolyticus]|uniref:Uncharacterized protein DUF2264 n=1 Tax=Breznakibacter xylanolyticus TaxID=990 RepID=A0A2W7NDA3_9BACT|nr:DUF2264 domain-containing protein [Breznakibacter xylanolyticus]PZX18128.1 uncharacterized protein DUF2264 [Breznakibacter xylanolyticus]
MKKKFLTFSAILWLTATLAAQTHSNTFEIREPDYQRSPLSGMTRQHWMDAAHYVLEGAFSYIHTMDDAMKFPKQHAITYPHRDNQVPTEKLEGLCRTLFVAVPLLKENPDLTLNGIRVADYYRHQIGLLIDTASQSFITPRAPSGGPNQNLVEFGALAISLMSAPEVLWHPLAADQKEALARVMLSYGDGPTVPSNWKFFNIFIMSFFKSQGYAINETLLTEYLDKSLADYRGQGWYNDNPAYDYYSMWAYQMYGMTWAHLFGKQHYPQYAERLVANFNDLQGNYPYLFDRQGRMIMWGRSISYRFGAIVPFPLMGFENRPEINYGWMRRIATGTLLQFLQHPDFMQEGVPTLGFYGPFEPAVQMYSCRGSVYWGGKAFLGLLVPADSPFWTSTENNGAWDDELKPGNVYNHFQQASNILITNYPNLGASEVRAWCHERVAKDWQKFRSTENYNRLAYNSAFPWQADGANGEVAMNYRVKNDAGQWEALRLFTFTGFNNGVYTRRAVLETNEKVSFNLADVPLPNGILRVDQYTGTVPAEFRLGHYALPKLDKPITRETRKIKGTSVSIINNGQYQLALVLVSGWSDALTADATGLHPQSNHSTVQMVTDRCNADAALPKTYVTLMLWKDANQSFSKDELMPVRHIQHDANTKLVVITLKNKQVVKVAY